MKKERGEKEVRCFYASSQHFEKIQSTVIQFLPQVIHQVSRCIVFHLVLSFFSYKVNLQNIFPVCTAHLTFSPLAPHDALRVTYYVLRITPALSTLLTGIGLRAQFFFSHLIRSVGMSMYVFVNVSANNVIGRFGFVPLLLL